MKIYVLTEEHNDYDQYGEYFVEAFETKPTKEQLSETIKRNDDKLLDHILNVGGRQGFEDVWWYLNEVELK